MKINQETANQIANAIDAFVAQNIVIPTNAEIETKPTKSAKKIGNPYTKEQLERMGNPTYVTDNGWITWE
jgi:hypothetical protein